MSAARRHGRRYDVLVAGARCAGASLAMLLSRQGIRVLVVDPAREGTDTLSTHALMRAGVLQLHRWGVLDAVRAAGTPPVRSTTFHYGGEELRLAIEPKDGVDALYAPRRTVLDRALVEAARSAGAEVAHETAVVDLLRDESGRVRGAVLRGPEGPAVEVAADLVVGADGARSRVASLADAEVLVSAPHAAGVIYGYWPGLSPDGYHWHFARGASAGAIPTNDGLTCVFVSGRAPGFLEPPRPPLDVLYHLRLRAAFPALAEAVEATGASPRLRGWAGLAGTLRRSSGPGWALVGDAGFFRDPITAHGISDALRDAELLARAVPDALGGGGDGRHAPEAYQATRDRVARGMLDVTDRIASFDWDLEEVKALHLALNREMKKGLEVVRGWQEAERPRERPLTPAGAAG